MFASDQERIKKYYEYIFATNGAIWNTYYNQNRNQNTNKYFGCSQIITTSNFYGLNILKGLIQIGTPEIVDDEECPTACMGLTGGRLVYQFGRNFYDQSTEIQTNCNSYYFGDPEYYVSKALNNAIKYPSIIFVAMHEVLHYLLAHIYNRRENKNSSVWNIATDIVINELLFRAKVNYVVNVPENILRAKDFNIKNIEKKSAEDVYNEIMQEMLDPISKMTSNVQNGQQKVSSTGSHDNWGELEDKAPTPEEVQAIYEGVCNREACDNSSWGDIAGNAITYVTTKAQTELAWDKILFDTLASHIIGVTQIEEKWAPPNRRLQIYYPNVILPSEHRRIDESKLLRLMIAIDCSGSIDDKLLNKFANAICALPEDKIHEPIVVGFDTQVGEMKYEDFRNGKRVKFHGRGGTNFSPIQNWAVNYETRTKETIDQIVVLTDGWAGRPNIPEAQRGRWVWVITPNGSTNAVKDLGKIIKVNKI